MSDQLLTVGGRPVADLKVVELRKELEIRSLPKSGNKKELIDRLANFLIEERAEQLRQQQGNQQQQNADQRSVSSPSVKQTSGLSEAKPFQKSPPAAPLPNVVAQYLAQQQIQLEAARRDADKIRAGSSSSSTVTTGEESAMVQVEEQQRQYEAVEKPQKSADFVPEEPSGEKGEEQLEQEEESGDHSDAESEKQEVEEDERAPSSGDTSTVGQREEESADQYEEQATEPVQDEEHAEMETETAQESLAANSEFVPEAPNEGKSASDNLKRPGDGSDEVSPQKSVKSQQPAPTDDEIYFENEEEDEEDEEREEPEDGGGKRRTRVSAVLAGGGEQAKDDEETRMEEGQLAEQVANEPPLETHAHVVASESSKPRGEPQEELTEEGFVRRRPLSPARNAVTNMIHIRGLKRPYTQRALLDLLGKFGTVDESAFWIDSIKSNCIITYETPEQAQQARDRMHNTVWPPAHDALCVEYSTEEKLRRRRADEQRDSKPNPQLGGLGMTIVVDNRSADTEGATVMIQHDKEQQKIAENRKRKAEELEKSQKTLDELFRKTKTQPFIYFLPLTDEQAAKRKKPSSRPNQSSSSQRSGGGDHSSTHRQHHFSSTRGSADHKSSAHHSSSSRR